MMIVYDNPHQNLQNEKNKCVAMSATDSVRTKGLLHQLVQMGVVVAGSSGWHEVFGTAVFAFKHLFDQARLTQVIELAMDGCRACDGAQGHGIRHSHGAAIRMVDSNHIKQ